MMPKPKIVYLSEVAFSPHMCRAFGVETLRKAGYEVELIEFSAALHPEYDQQRSVDASSFFSKVTKYGRLSDAAAAITAAPAGTLFILYMWFRLKTRTIFKALSEGHHLYVLQLQNSHPSPSFKELPLTRTLLKIISKPGLILEKIFTKIPLKMLGIRPADFFIAGGRTSASHRLIGVKTRILWTSAHDYGVYLDELNDSERLIHDKYVVFLDEYWPFHEDWVLIGKQLISPEKYYPKMRELFDLVGKKLGCRVVIAAHPRSHYEDKPGLYGDRRIIKGKTAQLVKDAFMVIAHDSLSLNIANLFEKPVLFTKFTFDPFFDGEVIPDPMAEAFGKRSFNLDEPDALEDIDFDKELRVDKAAYASYRENYIVTERGLGRKNWDRVVDYLNTLSEETGEVREHAGAAT